MKIIDLFAGCGGLSLGFTNSGFESVLAVEKDAWACETYSFNLHKNILNTEIQNLLDLDALNFPKEIVEGIVGGPPCQGFSLSGNRDPKDPRNSLFMEFKRFVSFYSPKFFVMENVPGILSMKTHEGRFVKDIILEEFNSLGYTTEVRILNAAEFGVPQTRRRVLFIGFKNSFNFNVSDLFPKPLLNEKEFITLNDAISDLPIIEAGQGSELMEYTYDSKNNFQLKMRKGSKVIHNHEAMKHTKRLIERFKNIDFGQSVADVSEEHSQRKRGDSSKISGKAFGQNNMRPFPYRPSPTLPASFQSNFIHPFYNRNFTAREGARIQSFPDRFVFKGKRTTMSWEKNLSQYQQIGNAVPPLLAEAIAKNIFKLFN
jgi:DNA (cytosine-5)-methyltransferase 1